MHLLEAHQAVLLRVVPLVDPLVLVLWVLELLVALHLEVRPHVVLLVARLEVPQALPQLCLLEEVLLQVHQVEVHPQVDPLELLEGVLQVDHQALHLGEDHLELLLAAVLLLRAVCIYYTT
jgi:hypothetical protein